MTGDRLYCEYFDVDEAYFPCIDEGAIRAGAKWETTYPHQTFISLLHGVDRMLGGGTKQSIWIYGAYGTGKSQCAFALKRILEVPADELKAYWDHYESLKNERDLLQKLLGHKERGILCAYRYASGGITSPQLLFNAVQESVRCALDAMPNSYKGEDTLKECVARWLEKDVNREYFDKLLQEPEWKSRFGQPNAAEVIKALNGGGSVTDLMDNIFTLADEEGIRAFTLTADSLCEWLKDVIWRNNTKIVLIWDEFADFLKQANFLSEFQKIVSLCQEVPFYFVIVTHPISSVAGYSGTSRSKNDPMTVVRQRFKEFEITLPSNIAFSLTAHAFSVKQSAKDEWDLMQNSLDRKVPDARNAVAKETGVEAPLVITKMLPIHPMAALVLRNIAAAFQANQRSIFTFIKTQDADDTHAFQYFIKNTGPLSDRPLLTVDMLWDFFYEKGKDYLDRDVRSVLDVLHRNDSLIESEKVVLKTILIMQALDQRVGGSQKSSGVSLFRPTDRNLHYAFEGDSDEYEGGYRGIAAALVDKGILVRIRDSKEGDYYSAARVGDEAAITKITEDVRKVSSTEKLVEEGDLGGVLDLSAALRLRYTQQGTGKLTVVTHLNFTRTMNGLKGGRASWYFKAVLALAKDESEAKQFRRIIRDTVSKEEYKDIIVIDALSMPLGNDSFEHYVEYQSYAQSYNGNNNVMAGEYGTKAKNVLNIDWAGRIRRGTFYVYSYDRPEGQVANGTGKVCEILTEYVLKRFSYAFDFEKGVSVSQLAPATSAKRIVQYGFADVPVQGLIKGCEKTVLGKVWSRDRYWEDSQTRGEGISVIKRDVDKLISGAFEREGRISIECIYDFLESEYGFPRCNVSAFVTGFLLKEYKGEPYRSQDSAGHTELMTAEKLSEMIGNCIGGKAKGDTYIVNLTEDEKAFYDLSAKAWNTDGNCSSPAIASAQVRRKMQELSFPVWCLESVTKPRVFEFVQLYIQLVQCDGKEASDVANKIGKAFRGSPDIADELCGLLVSENCQRGMSTFIEQFEGGKIVSLSKEIGAQDRVLADIKRLFEVEYSSQWSKQTAEDELAKLIDVYSFIKETNDLLNVSCHTKDEAFAAWRECLSFAGFSCEALTAKRTALQKCFSLPLKIAKQEEVLPENIKAFLNELADHKSEVRSVLNDSLPVFKDLYAPYLEDFASEDIEEIKKTVANNLFVLPAGKSNELVLNAAKNYRENQNKSKLLAFWSEKTDGTKNPREWSDRYKTPILCCTEVAIYEEARKTFSLLNGMGTNGAQSESEIQSAQDFLIRLSEAGFFDKINSKEYRDTCFLSQIVKPYTAILPSADEVRCKLEKLAIESYDWNTSPLVADRVKEIARAHYDAGGSDRAIAKIDSISDIDELKAWLKSKVQSDMEFGIQIIES